MDTLHIILSVAVLLGFFYANTISWKLDKANANLDVCDATNKELAETYNKLYKAYDKLGKEMDEITTDYNALADEMKKGSQAAKKLIEYHRVLAAEYESAVEDLHVIRLELASSQPEVLQGLYGNNEAALLCADDIMNDRLERVEYLKRMQDAERQEKA